MTEEQIRLMIKNFAMSLIYIGEAITKDDQNPTSRYEAIIKSNEYLLMILDQLKYPETPIHKDIK